MAANKLATILSDGNISAEVKGRDRVPLIISTRAYTTKCGFLGMKKKEIYWYIDFREKGIGKKASIRFDDKYNCYKQCINAVDKINGGMTLDEYLGRSKFIAELF